VDEASGAARMRRVSAQRTAERAIK
jgi:hypothetical protein